MLVRWYPPITRCKGRWKSQKRCTCYALKNKEIIRDFRIPFLKYRPHESACINRFILLTPSSSLEIPVV